MIFFLIGLVLILIALIISVLVFCFIKIRKQRIDYSALIVEEALCETDIVPKEMIKVNKHLILVLNKKETKLVAIKNFNPKQPTGFELVEIPVRSIKSIEKIASSIVLKYKLQGEENSLVINPINKQIINFIHKIFEKTCLSIIQSNVREYDFDFCSASDFECTYLWAYSKAKAIFACLDLKNKFQTAYFKFTKVNATIDTKYNYLEIPYKGMMQQLFVYNQDFLNALLESVLDYIKEKTITILPNKFYYDKYLNIIYLTNGLISYVSVLLNEVEEVYYSKNKIYFTVKNSDRIINFLCDEDYIQEFSEFIIGYNLRQLAINFNYKSDKLINTTHNTKLIVDYSRYRIIYCANVDTLSKFSYIVLSFSNIREARVEGKNKTPFVRIITNKNEAIDISCNKYEIAAYSAGLINKIKTQRFLT